MAKSNLEVLDVHPAPFASHVPLEGRGEKRLIPPTENPLAFLAAAPASLSLPC